MPGVKKYKMNIILVIIGLILGLLTVVQLLYKWDAGYDFISAECAVALSFFLKFLRSAVWESGVYVQGLLQNGLC